MTENMIENKLPKYVLDKAVKSGQEFGWRQSDFIDVIEAAKQMELAIIGGQIQYALNDGTCELYWLSYDPTSRLKNENWKDYCNRTAKECLDKFQAIISKTDIEKEAINCFEFLKSKKENGIRLSDYLIFILYFEDNKSDKIKELLNYTELQSLVYNENLNNNCKTCAEFLLNAITDYPKFNLQEPKELITELKKEIKSNLTYDNIDNYLKSLNPDSDAWKMETLSALLEMFDFYRNSKFDKNIELETIVENLTKYYRNKKK